MTDPDSYTPNFGSRGQPPMVPAPAADSPEGNEARNIHTTTQWLRNHIGGGWQWNAGKTRFEAFLTPEAAEFVNDALEKSDSHIRTQTYDEHHARAWTRARKDPRLVRLSVTPEEFSTLEAADIAWGATSLVNQYEQKSGKSSNYR